MTATADEIEAIHQLKARYFRLMDEKNWAGWARLFTEDFAMQVDSAISKGAELTSPHDIPTGREAIIAYIEKELEGAVSIHYGHMPEITLTSADSASGIWAMEEKIIFPDGSRLHGYGHYRETYRKEDGEWRIASLAITRLRLDMTSQKF
jgi:uncharacterized protein (TIGR02246 family)